MNQPMIFVFIGPRSEHLLNGHRDKLPSQRLASLSVAYYSLSPVDAKTTVLMLKGIKKYFILKIFWVAWPRNALRLP